MGCPQWQLTNKLLIGTKKASNRKAGRIKTKRKTNFKQVSFNHTTTGYYLLFPKGGIILVINVSF
jgi:hypothetical protein